jgi:hypothetical protein
VDGTDLTLVLTTAVLVLVTSAGRVMPSGLEFLYGGIDRGRDVVIRTGRRGNGVV